MATFFGTSGNDTLTGTNTSDQFYAGAGNDVITTGGGIDAVSAGDGNDILNLVPGDSGQGEGGADIFKISAGSNPGLNNGTLTIYGDYSGVDADVLDVSALIADGWTLDTIGITSTDGQNLGGIGSLGYHGRMVLSKPGFTPISIVYNDIESFITTAPVAGPVDGLATGEVMGPGYTDAQGDQIDGTDGLNDTIFGNAGNDTIDAGAGNDTVDGGAENDLITGGAGDDSVLGGTGSDTLAGGAGADVLDGGAGDDDIAVGGADTAAGGAGDDVFTLDSTDPATDINVTLDGGTDATSGNPEDAANGNAGDILDLSALTAPVTVTLATNPETGTVNGLDADVGTDISFTEIENILTGSGNDTIDGGSATGPVTLDTGAGDDSITTGSGNDTIAAGPGNDTVNAGNGDDSVTGGAGNDILFGGDGADVITAGVTGLPDIGYPGLYAADATPNDDLDTVYGGAGSDTISTGDDRDLVYGGDDGDSIDGGFDNDTLNGDGGNDTIEGGEGADLIYGGIGDDVIYGGLSNPALDAVNIDDATDLVPNNGLDTIYGGDGDDLIRGQDDADLLYGDAGADTLDGGVDNDSLYGGADNDSLVGGAGRDLLDGGAGVDTLTGGLGADQFVADGTADLITDFDATTGIGDGDPQNNDFVDLSAFYNDTTLAVWNANNPGQTYTNPLSWLRADQANGVLEAAGGLQITNGGVAVLGDALNQENTSVVCFSRGTMIATINGEMSIEKISVGDMVLTRDAGYQPVRWIGSRKIDQEELSRATKLKPIRIAAGALGNDLPVQDLLVSP